MHRLFSEFTHGAAAVAAALPQGDVGPKQLVYIILNNTSGANAAITPEAATAEGGFVAAAGEIWQFGPVQGQDLDKHGIYAALAANVGISYLTCVTSVDPRPPGGSLYDQTQGRAAQPLPFVWRQLA